MLKLSGCGMWGNALIADRHRWKIGWVMVKLKLIQIGVGIHKQIQIMADKTGSRYILAFHIQLWRS